MPLRGLRRRGCPAHASTDGRRRGLTRFREERKTPCPSCRLPSSDSGSEGCSPWGLLGAGIWLLATWYDALPRPTPVLQTATDGTRTPAPPPSVRERVTRWRPGFTWETAALGGGLLLVLGASGGGLLLSPLRWRAGTPVPVPPQAPTVEHLPGPDGTTLHLEILRSPGGAAAAGDPWLGRHQRAVVLPPPGCGGAVPPRRMGFTGPGPLDAPCAVRV